MGPKKSTTPSKDAESGAGSSGSRLSLAPSEIIQFRGDYHFLSNFYKSPIKKDGLVFPTIEHAFQAAKCLDKAGKQSILANKNPVIAKRLGRRVKLRPDWEQVKMDVMLELLRLKFAPGSELCRQLLSTGEAKIIEGNKWHDNFWGSCQCEKHRATAGGNALGKLLMRVRDERRCPKPETGTASASSGPTEQGA